jgi:hypothetical protein
MQNVSAALARVRSSVTAPATSWFQVPASPFNRSPAGGPITRIALIVRPALRAGTVAMRLPSMKVVLP